MAFDQVPQEKEPEPHPPDEPLDLADPPAEKDESS
jgi:hypothetical protein